MVVVEIVGGLGNQMFQYAMGRVLAEKLHTELKLDVASFYTYTLRKYELGCFNIQENFVGKDEIALTELNCWKRIVRYWKEELGFTGYIPFKMLQEKYFHFDPSVFEQQGNLYIKGYWQSEKYFKRCAAIISKEFTLKTQLSDDSKEYVAQISSCESVSIHVRRGDYVLNPETNKVHGVLPLEYYLQAMAYISQNIGDVQYYVFSDDIEWVKKYFGGISNVHIVSHKVETPAVEDMILMSRCKHNIIANSSFSWWSAWLNSNPGKTVIAPAQWFCKQDINTRDLLPDSWVKI